MINFNQKIRSIIILTGVVTSCSACGNLHNDNQQSANSSPQYRAASNSSYIEKTAITDNGGKTWVPLEPVLTSLGYRIKDETSNGGYAKIGYSDVMYMMRPTSRKVYSLGQQYYLPEAPQRRNGHIYMTTTSLSKFLQTKISLNPSTGEVVIDTPKDTNETPQAQTFRIQSTSVDTGELVSFAKRFLGVPYVFGAGSYEDTKTFDCSSFTRYVYQRFGVNLPRLAKDQDNRGQRVQRSQLQQGDLIFFTVPGRFKSDAIPGHVGIYIGNGKFIHTWGAPGVQISNLDSGYWSNVILHMQHIL